MRKPSSKTLLALDIDFEFNRAKLTDADRKTLADNVDAVCKLVEKHKQLTIEGHADSRGPAERNLELSQEARGTPYAKRLSPTSGATFGGPQLVA